MSKVKFSINKIKKQCSKLSFHIFAENYNFK
jgi:hypothetical protein